ncbi:MAG: TerB family tellurite resistance protein [Gammaproteobacteria bacterium]|nr:TerB family tellurite resistance protein [Gammaproteobacteria bacterium]MCW8986297.1 TerB family tellurite resistance protein [Gammaproteobacteria bacterium]MCW9031721.1 TerB family tellurite resistance protein [Gammaproteobacteria bacterium]
MLKAIKQFFEESMSSDSKLDNTGNVEHRLKLATAALFIEMMQQDAKKTDSEVKTVKDVLQTKFALSETETDQLFELAHDEARDAVDFHQFTSLINEHFSMEKKIKIVEYLWTIAYADNHLDIYEEHMVRRITDLLYVEHQDFIKAKHKVLDNLI